MRRITQSTLQKSQQACCNNNKAANSEENAEAPAGIEEAPSAVREGVAGGAASSEEKGEVPAGTEEAPPEVAVDSESKKERRNLSECLIRLVAKTNDKKRELVLLSGCRHQIPAN